jgi:uncharacterized membrane protein
MPASGPAIVAAAGAALGAATGALTGALTEPGINDDLVKQLAANLNPGNTALFLLVRKMTADKLMEHLKGTGGISPSKDWLSRVRSSILAQNWLGIYCAGSWASFSA